MGQVSDLLATLNQSGPTSTKTAELAELASDQNEPTKPFQSLEMKGTSYDFMTLRASGGNMSFGRSLPILPSPFASLSGRPDEAVRVALVTNREQNCATGRKTRHGYSIHVFFL